MSEAEPSEIVSSQEILERRRFPYLNPAGRPSKLTQLVHDQIVAAVANGSYWSVAAQAAGVTHAAIRDWILRGEEDQKNGKNTRFSRFVESCTRAQAECEAKQVAVLAAGGDGKYPDWRSRAFLLERRFRERWGPPKVESSPAITLTIGGAELAALVDALRVARATVVETTAMPTAGEAEKR